MAQRQKSERGDRLDRIRTLSDQIAEGIGANPVPILSAIAAILLTAAGVGAYATWSSSREDAASAALAEVRSEFQQAMGIQPGVPSGVEPANPEIARRAREEFAERFVEVARAHPDASAAPVALLEAGDLRRDAGEEEAALGLWREALEHVDRGSALRALLLQRIGAGEELAGRWQAAAEAYEGAAAVEAFPARYLALADAARAYATAGDSARALQLYTRIETEAPEITLPQHVRSMLAELRVRATAEATDQTDSTEPTESTPAP